LADEKADGKTEVHVSNNTQPHGSHIQTVAPIIAETAPVQSSVVAPVEHKENTNVNHVQQQVPQQQIETHSTSTSTTTHQVDTHHEGNEEGNDESGNQGGSWGENRVRRGRGGGRARGGSFRGSYKKRDDSNFQKRSADDSNYQKRSPNQGSGNYQQRRGNGAPRGEHQGTRNPPQQN